MRAARSRSPRRWASSSSFCLASICSLSVLTARSTPTSRSHRAVSAAVLLVQVGQLLLEQLQLPPRGLVLLLAQGLALDLQLHDPPADLIQFRRHRVVLDPQPAGRLVHQVDGLVRQEPVGDVAVAQRRRRHQGRVLDPHAVMGVVARLEPAQDRDGVLDGRLAHVDRLEPPLQGRVLLDVLAVLVQRGRADAAQLAAGQRRLEQVAGIHRPLGLPAPTMVCISSMNRMTCAVGLDDFLDHRLEPILELAADTWPRRSAPPCPAR